MGDSTFFHSGMIGAAEIIYNGGNVIPVILDNRITGMTGYQDNPGSGYALMGEEVPVLSVEKIMEAYGYRVFAVDPQDLTAMQKAVNDALAYDGHTDEHSALIRLCQYVFGYVCIELGAIRKVSMCKRIMKAETSTDEMYRSIKSEH